jgi:hypothetical protein
MIPINRAYSEIQRPFIPLRGEILSGDELMSMLENNSSKYCRIFCPICHFDDKFLQANKNLHQHQQVHDQEDAVDPCYRGISASGSNIVETIAVFSLTKLAFNRNPLPIFLLALRFLALHLIFVFWGKPYIFRSSANEVGW